MTEKRVVVTGASSGIGAATARLFTQRGWKVLGVARRRDRLRELADECGADIFVADLTKQEDVDALAEHVRWLGGAHALINNAGGAFGFASVESSEIDDWARMFEINVLGTKRVITALLPVLRSTASDEDGATIVGVTSVAGHVPYEGGGGYNAAKFAEHALLEVLRLELNGEPIRVVEVAPGLVRTDEFSLVRFGGDKAKVDAVYRDVPDPLTADDIAETIVHAVSLPAHVSLDLITMKPVAQSAMHKLARGELRMKRSAE